MPPPASPAELLRRLYLYPEKAQGLAKPPEVAAANMATFGHYNEGKLVDVFKGRGISVTEIDRKDFLDNVLKNASFDTYGYRKADWDKIQAVK